MNSEHVENLVQNVQQACDPCDSSDLMIVDVEGGVSILRESHDLVKRSGNSQYERGIVPDLFHLLIWKGAPCIITDWSNGVMSGSWESQHDLATFPISPPSNHIALIFQYNVFFLCSRCLPQNPAKA